MRIGLVPLDNRPAGVRVPALLARAAGAELVAPPPALVGGLGDTGDLDALAERLRETADGVDGLVVSLDQLVAGGVDAPDTDAPDVDRPPDPLAATARLSVLRDIARAAPDLPLLAFSVLAGPRDPGPPALAGWGTLLDRRALGEDVGDELRAAEAGLTPAQRRALVLRRMRAEVTALAALGLAADGTLDLLVHATATGGDPGTAALRRSWLKGWTQPLDVGAVTYPQPGAAELGGVLVARLLNAAAPERVTVGFYCPVPEAEKRVAPREDGPVARTVLRCLRTVGADLAESDVDVVLALHPPVAGDGPRDWGAAAPVGGDSADAAAALADEATRLQALGIGVVLADAAYVDGGDPVLVERLRSRVDLLKLAGYAAGSTAGDAIGAALAQGTVSRRLAGDAGRAAHELLVLHRFLDGWGYRTKVRWRLRRRLANETGSPEPTPETLAGAEAEAERELGNVLAQLPRFAGRYRVFPGSVRLPWGRTDECDFELERLDVPPAERR